MTNGEGLISIENDRAILTFERRLPHPVERVWAAITDPFERGQWMGDTTIDGREGGTIEMMPASPPIPDQQKQMTGRILVWDPPHVFEHEWNQRIVEPNANGFRPGTHAYLDRLEAHLAGAQLPGWQQHYAEVAETVYGTGA